MDHVHEDAFVVYVRLDREQSHRPEAMEQISIPCASYEEARQVRQKCHALSRECIIRYTGTAGGGD